LKIAMGRRAGKIVAMVRGKPIRQRDDGEGTIAVNPA
jgi:hypothetical protein